MSELAHKLQYLGVSIWSGDHFYKTKDSRIIRIPEKIEELEQ